MKQITNKTLLKQGDRTFEPVEVDGVIYWIDEDTTRTQFIGFKGYCFKEDLTGKIFKHFFTENKWYDDAKVVVAQSQPQLDLPWCRERFAERNSLPNSPISSQQVKQYCHPDCHTVLNLVKNS
jgi:hypothetical protein